MRQILPSLLLFLALPLVATDAASAQPFGPGEGEGSSPADSARVNRSARSEQADFERLRRRRMPETWPRGGGSCDERIGRFCLTHDDDAEDWIAPPEEREIVSNRLALIGRLTDAASLLPGDGWVAGQRVRYLVEARRFEEAVTAAGDCRAGVSWCAALAGYALHYAGRPAEADSAFTAALASMPEAERARWNDLRYVLEGASARAYRRLEPAEREAFEQRFWRLADPFFIRPGNELRSEHLARHVMDQFQERAQSPDGIHWGSDLREILIRYGWPAGWERVRTTGFVTHDASFISHYSSAPQYLLPPAATLLGDSTEEREWDVERRRARTGYDVPLADSVARWFHPLSHQLAVFRRGDDALVATVYELPADSLPAEAAIHAGLALIPLDDAGTQEVVSARERARSRGWITAAAAGRRLLASLEIAIPEERRAARAREEVALPPLAAGEIALSDLLLIEPTVPLPDSLPAALEIARSSARVGAGEAIGVYWELYGTPTDGRRSVIMSLRLLEERRGWLGRLAVRAGLLREVVPIRLRWEEPVADGQLTPRSVALRVPEVSPGAYVLELSAETAGREAVAARRDIEIVAGAAP